MTIPWDSSTVLKVSALSKRFGRFHALENVGFEVRAGEILGLIGPNGVGKNTLFEVGMYESSINAENLFNRQRYFTASDYDNQVYPGPPLNVFTTIRLRFR